MENIKSVIFIVSETCHKCIKNRINFLLFNNMQYTRYALTKSTTVSR